MLRASRDNIGTKQQPIFTRKIMLAKPRADRSGFSLYYGPHMMKESLPLADLGDVLTPSDVQRVLGIGRNATYELLASGKLPSIRVTPRRIVVTRRALEAFLGLVANMSIAGTP
jgi:hypothetical protein